MRYRKAKNYKEKLSVFEGKTYIDLSSITKLDIKEAYTKNQPLMLEIGCGKGGFLLELARRNPEVNYLGIEKNDALLLEAVTKASEENLDNIKFVSFDASKIEDFLLRVMSAEYILISQILGLKLDIIGEDWLADVF